jgi:hypothetical protein
MYDISSTASHIRVGDAEREAIADRLRRHHTEGRIDVDEFQERLDRCYQATTAGQLRELVTDLPGDPRSTTSHPDYRRRLIPFVPLLLVILTLGALTSGHSHAWFPLVFLALFFTRFLVWGRPLGRGYSRRG